MARGELGPQDLEVQGFGFRVYGLGFRARFRGLGLGVIKGSPTTPLYYPPSPLIKAI